MIVCKFGGTSVADGAALERLAGIVRERLPLAPLVVVSAVAGVSDSLISVLDQALAGRNEESAGSLETIAERHRHLLQETAATPAATSEVLSFLGETMLALESMRQGVTLLRDAGPWVRARFIGAGEILSSRIVTCALQSLGMEASWHDAKDVVRTAGVDPEKDPPVISEIARLASLRLAPSLRPGCAVVTQGFIGSDALGRPTLLGRGGSDYTASLLGTALGADRIEIWTDVDGVLTADPKIVPEARRVRLLSFGEASELAYFGARVLHPSTVLPAIEAAIPVWVGNSRRPSGHGTTILADATRPVDDRWVVKAIAGKRGLTVIQIVSTRMLMAHGFLARIFEAFDGHRTAVDLVATSEVSVSLTVDDDRGLAAIVARLSEFAKVEIEPNMAVVCLVGDGMRGRAGLAADVFRALRGTRVRMITQGASAINLSLVVPEADLGNAVRALHETFFHGSLPSEIFGESVRDMEDLEFVASPAAPSDSRHGYIQGIGQVDLARRHGTPLYVYDLDSIEERTAWLRQNLPGKQTRIFYACKANANARILECFARLGVGVEAASPGELERALACGHPPGSVVLSASNARPEALASALSRGCTVTVGSPSDIRRLGELANGAAVLLRVNPGLGDGHHPYVVTGGVHSKFGIPIEDVGPALEEARRSGLTVMGLHAHIGSGILDPAPLLASADRLLDAARSMPELRVLDLGGGFGIPYRESEAEFDFARFGRDIANKLDAFERATGGRPEVWFEPGRFLVGPAGVLVAEVTCRKESGGMVFIGLDTGMNHLLRPALYGSYHRIVNLSAPEGPLEWVEIVGNVCETTDVFASNRPLPRAEEGHLLGILDCGAYGFSMASRYNLWPLPVEIVLSGGREI